MNSKMSKNWVRIEPKIDKCSYHLECLLPAKHWGYVLDIHNLANYPARWVLFTPFN